MHGLANKPVIPSLHDDIQCSWKDCLFHKQGNYKVLFIQDKERLKPTKLASYHSCVKIINSVTNAFTPRPSSAFTAGDPTVTTTKQYTLWYSNNGDDVGSLFLIQFFAYYSDKSNFKGVYFSGRGLGKQLLDNHHFLSAFNIIFV